MNVPLDIPNMDFVCGLDPHSKFPGSIWVGVDRATGEGYALYRAEDQEGRECFILRRCKFNLSEDRK